MKPIAIVYNPRAGRGKNRDMAIAASTVLDRKGLDYELFGQEWPDDFSLFEAVWIFGGDGTLNYFINHAKGEVPPMAIFKGGTGNDFASTLYGNATLEEMVRIILNASPKKVDAGICNGQYFLNMAGFGFDGETLRNMSMIRWMGAAIGYYVAVVKTIFTYREAVYTIACDGQPPEQRRLLLVFANNAPAAGGGFKVSPLADPADGKLNLLLCQPLGIVKRLLKLSLIQKGRHLEEPFISHQFISRLQIETPHPIAVQIDGELVFGRHFDVRVCPGQYSFLY